MNTYLLIGVVAILVIGGGWWYLNKPNVPLSETRTPTLQESTNTATQAPIKPSTSTMQTTSPSPTSGTANWKTYRSEKWGIEFKYPSSFALDTFPSGSEGYDLPALVDSQRNCYIGPIKETGFAGSTYSANETSIKASNQSFKITYLIEGELVFIGYTNLIAPDQGPWLTLGVASLSNGLIAVKYRDESADRIVSADCVKDFETILTTVNSTN